MNSLRRLCRHRQLLNLPKPRLLSNNNPITISSYRTHSPLSLDPTSTNLTQRRFFSESINSFSNESINVDNSTKYVFDIEKQKLVLKTSPESITQEEVIDNEPAVVSPKGQDKGSKKTNGKSKVCWVCSSCGNSTSQWSGKCRFCGEVGTLTKMSQTDVAIKDKKTRKSWIIRKGEALPQRLTDVNKGGNQVNWRIPLSGLFGAEVGRVLGGGLVPGCLVLVGGDPGVGKSTLMLQIAAMLAEEGDVGRPAPVLYVSGEESVDQIGNRADRMGIATKELFLYSGTGIEDILKKAHLLSPRALIIDSIQTMYLDGVTGSAGGIMQVKECTSALLRYAKNTNVPVFLIGHVTKSGEIAGPRVLEHIVDVVLYMEGEKCSSHRFLRSVKNRFGSTDELGVFEMSQSGLQAVANPSEIFLSEQYFDFDVLAGLAIAVVIDGSRTFLIEIQALCTPAESGSGIITGIDHKRVDMITGILMKQAGLKLQDSAIFVNVVSGVKLTETSGDLAIAAAICSSFLEVPIPNDVAFIGEIGLGGELRVVSRMEKRVNAVSKLGYRRCIVPKSAEKSLASLDLGGEMEILGCKNLKEVINAVFQNN
ncbi:hypothetical protein MKW94_027332 [Papaver nudicaule]|uniref:RecA family profile 1 domain-containing protein n=1 Tax=Papaver nudicaule TaxID=74823 RepID=A0AA41S293_PAPNU|nr:hypothetical protein [Papaver nudicaule]